MMPSPLYSIPIYKNYYWMFHKFSNYNWIQNHVIGLSGQKLALSIEEKQYNNNSLLNNKKCKYIKVDPIR